MVHSRAHLRMTAHRQRQTLEVFITLRIRNHVRTSMPQAPPYPRRTWPACQTATTPMTRCDSRLLEPTIPY